MTKVAVVYHSGYGHTGAQAQAVARGAQKVEGADVAPINSDLLTAEHLGERVATVAKRLKAK
jgi:flavorubredoxin